MQHEPSLLTSILRFLCLFRRPVADTNESSVQSGTESLLNVDTEKRIFGKARVKLTRFAHEQRAAKTLGIVMGVFIFCWLPFFMLTVLTSIFQAKLPEKLHNIVFAVFTWLGYINSGCNPIIYAFSSRDFKRAFQKILCPKSNQYASARVALNGEPKNCQMCCYYERNYLNQHESQQQIHAKPTANKKDLKMSKSLGQLNSISAQQLRLNSPSPLFNANSVSSIKKSEESLAGLNFKRTSTARSSLLRRLRRRLIILLNRRHAGFARNEQFPIIIGTKYTFKKTDL